MEINYATASGHIWITTSDPDNNVHNPFSLPAEVGNFFYNTSAKTFWMCDAIDGLGVQSWTKWYPQLQSDWSQSSSSAFDYIKNKPSLAAVATSGSYNDLSNKPVFSFSTPTFSSATAAAQLSTTRSSQVVYNFPTSMTSLVASQSLSATLQYADDSGFTTNVVTVNSDVQGCSGILSLTLLGRLQVQGIIPAGKYRKVVLAQTGGATVPTTLSSGQEVLL